MKELRVILEMIKYERGREDSDITHYDIMHRDGHRVGQAKTKNGARKSVDNWDNKYGGYAHTAVAKYKPVATNEGIVYHDHEGGKFNPTTPIDQWDPHPHYEKHLENHHMLNFIMKNSKDAREKAQASKELGTAEKKMSFWSKHPRFEQKKGEDIHSKVRQKWNPVR